MDKMQTHRPTYVSVPEGDLNHILQRAILAAHELQHFAALEYPSRVPAAVHLRERDIADAQRLIDFISVFRTRIVQAGEERFKPHRTTEAVTEKG